MTWAAVVVAGTGIALALTGTPAGAHMPYVLPSTFEAGARKQVTIEAAFGEDAFRPEIGMRDAPFEITGPDGMTTRLDTPALLTDMTIVEAPLARDGLYRLSSGQRLGRMNKMYREGGAWKIAGEDGEVPAGAAIVTAQSTTLADAYVLHGRPGSMAALKPRGTALEIHPLGDPSAYGAKEAATFEILYRGRPLAGTLVTLFREAGYYDGTKQVIELKTDTAGRVSLTPPDAGRYLMLVRHRDAAPAGAAAPYYSYTVTLAFQAM
ncbi:DUF4198 domain-containing protein [Sphingomonas sp.]|uniref:DUF4198 domain-containing protein n=1 Tax=Sphingomonas sp. TaxID=28214 RepID=UPI000DB15D34|nr:DUF4198 domain-containing protein [Sphingomonas sp.]PZU07988.1 MAG: DUF4198 domain-containing protein [Sphingomonas sp.]